MKTRRPLSPLQTRAILILLLFTVLVPGLLSLSIGIVALALSRQAFDVIFGILVLVFASTGLIGGVLALAFLRRSERLGRLQTDFVANVSHELRTPLAGIRLLVETVARGRAEQPEKKAEVISLLMGHIQRLEDLVERILKWQVLESARITYDMSPQKVSVLVDEALKTLAGPPGTVENRVEVTMPADLPDVKGDRKALADAFRNLIDNALKFGGDKGPVEVVGRSLFNEVIVEVRDQGPGIPRHARKRIFERFYRVAVHQRSKQGIGLGLAIVRHVIKDHGGHIDVESEPGMGSAFMVYLPAAPRGADDR
jgi:two-component system, OmpR family, phosphate regulon sensor histidine kinase PhoR